MQNFSSMLSVPHAKLHTVPIRRAPQEQPVRLTVFYPTSEVDRGENRRPLLAGIGSRSFS
uniref:Uncharacterized protein n=1 Tax=Rhizophora mucronata TaxID=61149 RepID=A0A2P2NTA6_RHIMU